MPILPTHALLAKHPAQQACYGFDKKPEPQTQIDLSQPVSYNDILNSPPTEADGKARWEVIKNNIIESTSKGHYSLHKETYFAYEIGPNPSEIGIVGCIPNRDLKEEVIEHEATQPHRVKAFADYLAIVGMQAEPCVITFRNKKEWKEIETAIRKTPPFQTFEIEGIPHRIWTIRHEQEIIFAMINSFFRQLKRQYMLIDGHHRKQAIHRYAKQFKDAYLLSYCLPHTAIRSKSFVWSSRDMTAGMEKWIRNKAKVVKNIPEKITKAPMILFRLNGQWYKFKTADLQKALWTVQRKLDRETIQVQKRPQIKSVLEIDRKHPDTALVILFSPISPLQLMHWSKKKMSLPAKTTYMEPKILTGLFLQTI